MSTTATEITLPEVGQRFWVPEQQPACPVGAIINWRNAGTSYIRQEDGWHQCNRDGSGVIANRYWTADRVFSTPSGWTLTHLPDPERRFTFEVGHVINGQEEMDAVPIGTVVRLDREVPPCRTWRRTSETTWEVIDSTGNVTDPRNPHTAMATYGVNVIVSLPPEPGTPAEQFAIGTHFGPRDPRMDEAPVGTIIHMTGRGINDTRIKQPNSLWRTPTGLERSRDRLDRQAGYDVVAIPGVEMTKDQVLALPDGIELRYRHSPCTFIKHSETIERRGGTNPGDYPHAEMSHDGWSLPAPEVPSEAPVVTVPAEHIDLTAPMGVRMFKQRIRTLAYAGCRQHSVNTGALPSIWDKLNVREEPMTPGRTFAYYDLESWQDAGFHLVLSMTNDEGGRSLYGFTNGQYVRLAGPESSARMQPHVMAEVISINDEVERPEWMLRPIRDDETERLIRFRRRLGELGLEAKHARDWCGAYERIVNLCWVNSYDSAEPTRMTAEQVANLPADTYLTVTNGLQRAILRRSDGADNPTRTVRLGGELPGNTFDVGWVTVYDSIRSLLPISPWELGSMPDGTSLISNGTVYHKSDGMWNGYAGTDITFTEDTRYNAFVAQTGA